MKRMTKQKQAILECFRKMKRPLSIEEISRGAAIHLSTVYRNVKWLVEEKIIREIALPGGERRYEVFTHSHHHHFLCESCDCLYEITGCPQGISALVPEGFKMKSHSITLHGTCPTCCMAEEF